MLQRNLTISALYNNPRIVPEERSSILDQSHRPFPDPEQTICCALDNVKCLKEKEQNLVVGDIKSIMKE